MINDFDFANTCDISGFLKDDIRAMVLYKSETGEDDIVIDINSGIGEISAELSNFAMEVYCIDDDENAIAFSNQNIRKHGNIDKVKFINENPLSALDKIESFDIAIIRHKEEDIDELLEKIHEKINSKGRILILTNIVEDLSAYLKRLDQLNYNPQVSQINISKGLLLNKGLKLIADNPMTIVYAKKR